MVLSSAVSVVVPVIDSVFVVHVVSASRYPVFRKLRPSSPYNINHDTVVDGEEWEVEEDKLAQQQLEGYSKCQCSETATGSRQVYTGHELAETRP